MSQNRLSAQELVGKQPLNRYYNGYKLVPNSGGGSGNDWLRVKNTLGIQIVGIHITDLTRV